MPKHLVPQTHTNTNKKLHNLFPISVHSLLAKLNYQCSSLLHVGHRNVPNRRRHPNNLRQREQLPKTTPLARQMNDMLSNAAQISFTNSLCYDIKRYMGSTVLTAPTSRKAQGRSASGRNGGARKTTSSNSVVMRIASKAFVLDFVQAVFSIRHFMTNCSSLAAVCVRSSFVPA